MRFRAVVLLVLMSLFGASSLYLSGCSSKPVNENDPASLYADAEDDVKSDRYQMALEKLKTVKNKFPYSKYAIDAQLRIADLYYLQELYPEAAASYETFRDLHPKHEKVEYAMFRIAKSYFMDIPSTVARDLTPAQKAQDAYNDFLKHYPAAPETPEAQKDLLKTRDLLASKELYIGDFYYKRDFYESAKARYQKILDVYPDTDTAHQAKAKLDKTNEQIDKNKGS
jgi:outer membrane protein assembly factor BamD